MRRPEDDFPTWGDEDPAPPDQGARPGPTVVNAAAPAPGPLFEPVTRRANKPVPEREWHVAELIPAAQVTMLGGEPGSGKSLLAKQLALATAGGLPWVGRVIGRPGPALYLSAEDDEDELHRRLAAICAAEGLDLAELPDLRARSMADADALLATADRRTGKLVPTELYRRLDPEMGRVRPTLLGL
ncbi:MAG: AAA family ATPase, partial [Paracoccaceae bacterium]|nr:AAA family ATPase [Paracoccaceae bacterium]